MTQDGVLYLFRLLVLAIAAELGNAQAALLPTPLGRRPLPVSSGLPLSTCLRLDEQAETQAAVLGQIRCNLAEVGRVYPS
jgi:hypothetical protein